MPRIWPGSKYRTNIRIRKSSNKPVNSHGFIRRPLLYEPFRDFEVIKKLSSPFVSIIFGALCLAALDPSEAKGKEKDWITLNNCRLIPNKSNDGDSFHVRANDTEYLVRLYFVDAPETASVGPERLIDQAKYFGLSVPQTIEIGRDAKRFVESKLSEPFSVVTRLAEGLGRSNVRRIYGFVRTKEGDLGEQLIANGLARIHGITAALPGGVTSVDEREKLAQLQAEAKRRKIGGWGMTGQSSNGTRSPLQSQPNDSPSIPVTPTSSSSAVVMSPAEVKNRAKQKTQLGNIDVNTATEKELTTVPGIGHVMAARIIAARPFRSADDLKKVSGIGDKKYAQIRPYFQ
jgi:DNA uptake protein ComE-like DNA-binding protein